ncbi:pectate lyase B [Apiospora arundinis]
MAASTTSREPGREDGLSQNLGSAALSLPHARTSSVPDVGGIASSPDELSLSPSCSTPISSSPSDEQAADDPESSNDDDGCGDHKIKGPNNSSDSGIDSTGRDVPGPRNMRWSRLRQHNAVEKRYRQTVQVAIEALGVLTPPSVLTRAVCGNTQVVI